MMQNLEAIIFDCKNCGATLDVPENAVAAKCSHCGSQHRIMHKEGVVTVDLIRTVARHSEELQKLEQIEQARRSLPKLEEERKRLYFENQRMLQFSFFEFFKVKKRSVKACSSSLGNTAQKGYL